MSGYRTLHRENTNNPQSDDEKRPTTSPIPIWHTQFSPCAQSRPFHHRLESSKNHSPPLRFLTACADGYIRSYEISDKELSSSNDTNNKNNNNTLDASALKMRLTSVLLGPNQLPPPPVSPLQQQKTRVAAEIGYSKIDMIRNYTGQDRNSGDEVIVALKLDGVVRIWVRPECPPYLEEEKKKQDTTTEQEGGISMESSKIEFKVEGCTGTAIAIKPPFHSSSGTSKRVQNLTIAIGNLNGSVSFYDSGIPIYNPHHAPPQTQQETSPSTPKLLYSIGSGGAMITSLVYHPSQRNTLAVGRKDGTIDVYAPPSSSYEEAQEEEGVYKRCHHFTNHYKPVRALAFSSTSSSSSEEKNDGALLITASDDGHIFLYDIYSRSSSSSPLSSLMVAAVPNAHSSWILSTCSIPNSSSGKFVTSGADGKVKIWDCSRINQGAVHTFDTVGMNMVWGVSVSYDGRRMVSCDDGGMIQVYSCEE